MVNAFLPAVTASALWWLGAEVDGVPETVGGVGGHVSADTLLLTGSFGASGE